MLFEFIVLDTNCLIAGEFDNPDSSICDLAAVPASVSKKSLNETTHKLFVR